MKTLTEQIEDKIVATVAAQIAAQVVITDLGENIIIRDGAPVRCLTTNITLTLHARSEVPVDTIHGSVEKRIKRDDDVKWQIESIARLLLGAEK